MCMLPRRWPPKANANPLSPATGAALHSRSWQWRHTRLRYFPFVQPALGSLPPASGAQHTAGQAPHRGLLRIEDQGTPACPGLM